jgi:hypothetical protein
MKTEEALPQRLQESMPDALEQGVAQLFAIGYGLTFGALYAVTRPAGGNSLQDGTTLGACMLGRR